MTNGEGSKHSPLFPCIEQPHRCILSIIHNGNRSWLSSNAKGSIILSSQRHYDHGRLKDEFQLIPIQQQQNDSRIEGSNSEGSDIKYTVLIKSIRCGRFLVCFPDNRVGLANDNETAENMDMKQTKNYENLPNGTQWKMVQCKNGGIMITTADYDLELLTANDNNDEEGDKENTNVETEQTYETSTSKQEATSSQLLLCVSKEDNHIMMKSRNEMDSTISQFSMEWNVQFQTGELLFISSPYCDLRLRCDMSGDITLSNNWKGWEVWRFIETGDSNGSVYISSFCHEQTFLCSYLGMVFTTSLEKKTKTNHNASSTNEVTAKSGPSFKKDTSSGSTNDKFRAFNAKFSTWSQQQKQQISQWSQQQKQQLETAIEKSRSAIQSNMERVTNLSIDDKAKQKKTDENSVLRDTIKMLTEEDLHNLSKWIVEKSPMRNEHEHQTNHNGVIIKSVATGRILRTSGKSVYTSREGNINFAIWDLQSAHRQTYYITTIGDFFPDDKDVKDKKGTQLKAGRRMGVDSHQSLYLSIANNPIKKQSEEWEIQICSNKEPSLVSLYCDSRKVYLGSTESGQLFSTSSNKLGSTIWKLTESAAPLATGHIFTSHLHKRILASSKDGHMHTVPSESQIVSTTRILWNMEPRIPRQMNSSKMKTLAIASTAAVATTVAAPFVISGAVGLLGIAEVGLAAEIVAGVGLAAEALSSVVLVGNTARALMHSAEVGTEDENGQRNTSENRPFCDWRNW